MKPSAHFAQFCASLTQSVDPEVHLPDGTSDELLRRPTRSNLFASLFASSTLPGWTNTDEHGHLTASLGRHVTRLVQRETAWEAEGVRFELTSRRTTGNGFRDRRIRPLCHPSGGAEAGASTRGGEGGIRTLEGGYYPLNALAGRRLQPLGHFSANSKG